ncbi:MAG: ADP-ribosylglycohydrolase family protein [Clostridia bacterium]|nr:ADP-ribosylglycohydrolase family protein [Clostridia bacterium]
MNTESMTYKTAEIKPEYEHMHPWEVYAFDLMTEYEQCRDEGLCIEPYYDLFTAVSRLPNGEIKKQLGDVIFELVRTLDQKEDYIYVEPSDLDAIKALRKRVELPTEYDKDALAGKIHGAWMGRICGCLLGKTVEGVRTNELIPFLTETGNYPMHRYILKSDITDDMKARYGFPFHATCHADNIDGMPVDDDTNYVVLAQLIIERYGRDFTPLQVSQAWMELQSKNAYCTAERVAYRNFAQGLVPPASAMYQNPYREWIGAQIRGDYFGYINPGNPEKAADMAWRDASISHVKNGIYGEMFASAMIATAAVTGDIETIILGGLGEIPYTSRLYEDVSSVIAAYKSGMSADDCFAMIHKKYNEYTSHGWCHTISNAMIVAASLLYGEGDFGKSICTAVQTGFDTDCNGATVGSVLGMRAGIDAIPSYWKDPLQDTLHTSIFGVGTVRISECAAKTLAHVQ